MITLLFFAKLREDVGTASLELEFNGSVAEAEFFFQEVAELWKHFFLSRTGSGSLASR